MKELSKAHHQFEVLYPPQSTLKNVKLFHFDVSISFEKILEYTVHLYYKRPL